MPDGDIIPRKPVRLWKRPCDLICSKEDAEKVSDGIYHSLLVSLRDKGGLPGAKDFAAIVEALMSGRVSLPDALDQLHDVEWQNGVHVHARVAAAATARLLVEVSNGEALGGTPLDAVLDQFCSALISYQLLGRIGPDQQGVRFCAYEDYLAWERQILEPLRPRLQAIVSELTLDPTGKGLKRMQSVPAPARPLTGEMLDVDLLQGALVERGV